MMSLHLITEPMYDVMIWFDDVSKWWRHHDASYHPIIMAGNHQTTRINHKSWNKIENVYKVWGNVKNSYEIVIKLIVFQSWVAKKMYKLVKKEPNTSLKQAIPVGNTALKVHKMITSRKLLKEAMRELSLTVK